MIRHRFVLASILLGAVGLCTSRILGGSYCVPNTACATCDSTLGVYFCVMTPTPLGSGGFCQDDSGTGDCEAWDQSCGISYDCETGQAGGSCGSLQFCRDL